MWLHIFKRLRIFHIRQWLQLYDSNLEVLSKQQVIRTERIHFCFGSDLCASTLVNSIFPASFLVTVMIKDPFSCETVTRPADRGSQTLTRSKSLIQAKDLRAGIEGSAVYQSGSDAPGKQPCKGEASTGVASFITMEGDVVITLLVRFRFTCAEERCPQGPVPSTITQKVKAGCSAGPQASL